jgi:hypothetical protein
MGSFFVGEQDARRPRRDADREGRRISREHPSEFGDILRQQLREARMQEKPLFHLKNIRKAEGELLPALEGRIDRHELNRRARPLVENFLRGVIPDVFRSKDKRVVRVPVRASKRGRPEYSPALLSRLDYAGKKGAHGSLRLRMGELMLAREKIRDALLRLTEQKKDDIEHTSSREEKDAVRDTHRHRRLALLRELKETQTELLEKTKALDIFSQTKERSGAAPSLLNDAYDRARGFLTGASPKTPKKVAAPVRGGTPRGSGKKSSAGSPRGAQQIPDPLFGIGQAVQRAWSRLSGTQSPRASLEELYTAIEQGLARIADIEQRFAEKVEGAAQQSGGKHSDALGDPDETEAGASGPTSDSVSAASADEKAAVFTPLASRILGREELKGISPDGLRSHIMARLLLVTGSGAGEATQHDLMTKAEFEKELADILRDPHTTEQHFDDFNTFLDQEISQLNSNPQSTTFKGGMLLSIFTRTVQMVAGERQTRLHTAQVAGDFLRRVGILPSSEKVDVSHFAEHVEAYVRVPGRTDQEIAILFNQLNQATISWGIEERLVEIFSDGKKIVSEELERRKKLRAARGVLLFHLGISQKQDQPIPQEQFEEAFALWLSDPGRTIQEFQDGVRALASAAAQEKDNQHIRDLYANVGQRIASRIHDMSGSGKEELHERLIETELGILIHDLGIQKSQAPISPSAAQTHVDAWLAGAPQWSDQELKAAFSAVSSLLVKEGMEEIQTGAQSPFLPFLRAVSAHLKEERARRPSFFSDASSQSSPTEQRGTSVSAVETAGDHTSVDEPKNEYPDIEDMLGQQLNVLRGRILQRFDISGADVAVGEKYFMNRLHEWLSSPQTSDEDRRSLLGFCQQGISALGRIHSSRKSQKKTFLQNVSSDVQTAPRP